MARAQRIPTNRKPTKEELELCVLARQINGDDMSAITLRIQKTVFDLDSKQDVTVIKEPSFEPVASMDEFLKRVNHDAHKVLEIVNDGLQEYTRSQAVGDASLPWMQEDEEGNKTPFAGTLLSEEKSKQLQVNILNMAKMMFGYTKEADRDTKRAAKQQAADMLLGNPVVVEALKKS